MQNTQHEPMEYRLRWVPDAIFLHWACRFHVVYVNFISVRYQTQTRFSVEYGLKAYIPLRCQPLHVGVWRWVTPRTRRFRVTYTNMLVSKNAKIFVTPNAKHKICVTPNVNHHASQWNIALGPQPKFSRWPCTFHVVCAHFIRIG